MSTELIAFVVAFILLLATFIVVTRIKNSKIEELEKKVKYQKGRVGYYMGKVDNIRNDYQVTRDIVEEQALNITNLQNTIESIERGNIVQNLEAISNKGNKLNYFKVQVIDKKDLSKFTNVKVGDKIAYVTRRVKGKTKNIPVKVSIKRD